MSEFSNPESVLASRLATGYQPGHPLPSILTRGHKKMSSILVTNSALVQYMNAGGGGGSGVSANEYSCAPGALINFGNLTPYLTYDINRLFNESCVHCDSMR
jgi:hypothetical protein